MPKKKTNKLESKKSKMPVNPVIAGVTGAVIGAGAAVAGTVVMSDQKNRKKVGKVVNAIKNQAADYVEGMQSRDAVKAGKKMVNHAVDKATNKINAKSQSSTHRSNTAR